MVDSQLIQDIYIIKNKLGQGGSSITYRAINKKTNEEVAIKALSLIGLDNWKKIELFEREARILQQLEHPAIPSYLDYFKTENKDNVYFYIVQQLAPGQSLAELISQGWQPEKEIVKNIAKQILEILVYLQELTPPIIHRDIKPQNIIYQPDTGKLFLVDFGAVQDTYHHTVMGSTVVGTYGYMAPEQYRGGAFLATDLYSLGCTLLFLLTGKSPADLPQKKLKIDFRKSVSIQKDFANWIDKLIEPDVNNRFPNGEVALSVLEEKEDINNYQNSIIAKPKYSNIYVIKDREKLTINIPPLYKLKKRNFFYYFVLFWQIIFILNRLAVTASVLIIGKIYLIIWIASTFITRKKNNFLIIPNIFLLLYSLLLLFVTSVPNLAVVILMADIILESTLEYNFILQSFVATKIIFSSAQNQEVNIARKLFKSWKKKTINYNKFKFNDFLTNPEKKWLQAEIKQYYSKN